MQWEMENQWKIFYTRADKWLFDYSPRILLAIIVLVAGQWLIRFTKNKATGFMKRRRVHSSLQPFFHSLIYLVLEVLLVLLVMGIMGIKLTIFAALIAALGAAAGLSLSGTLQNFASGVLILLLKPFKVGDNIVAQGMEGTVSSIQVFYTIITTYDNRTVIIPNGKLSNEVILNITQQGVRRLDVEFKFPYQIEVAAARKILQDAIAAHSAVVKQPEQRIGVSALGESSYTLTLNVWLSAHGFEDARLQLQEAIAVAIRTSGVLNKPA